MSTRRWRSTDKSIKIVRRVTDLNKHYHGALSEAKHQGGTRYSPATAAELLEKDDIDGKLSATQRELFTERAGDKYKKRDPFEKHPKETTDDFIRRINKIMGTGAK